MAFVRGKMALIQANSKLSAEDEMWIEKLGGRASDLDTVRPIHTLTRITASKADAVLCS